METFRKNNFAAAVTALLFISVSTSGCAFRPQLQRVAVNHNELVASSANELMLLNVLRAKERQPLHFTSVSKLVGNAAFTGTAAANVSIRADAPTVKTGSGGALVETSTVDGTEVTIPSLQAVITAGSSFDVAVFDTQEFYQGITTSIPQSTVAHYIHQGWPADLMTHLFIGSVDFVAKKDFDQDGVTFKAGETVLSLDNDPENIEAIKRFTRFFECNRLYIYGKSTPDRALLRLSQLSESSGVELLAMDGDRLEVDELKDQKPDEEMSRWVRRKGRTSDAIAVKAIDSSDDCKSLRPEAPAQTKGQPSQIKGWNQNLPDFGKAVTYQMLTIEPLKTVESSMSAEREAVAIGEIGIDNLKIEVNVQLVLRSIDGVIYYLGEYLREDSERPMVIMNKGAGPIIVASAERPAQVFAQARFQGRTYYVPGGIGNDSGRSSQVFALVQQLVNLQKSAKDRPTTQSIRVVP